MYVVLTTSSFLVLLETRHVEWKWTMRSQCESWSLLTTSGKLIQEQHISGQKEENWIISSFFSKKGLLTLKDLIWKSEGHALPTSQATRPAETPCFGSRLECQQWSRWFEFWVCGEKASLVDCTCPGCNDFLAPAEYSPRNVDETFIECVELRSRVVHPGRN